MLRFLAPSRTPSARQSDVKPLTRSKDPFVFASSAPIRDRAPILTPELLNPIIDEVARLKDTRTLRACALVHSTFVCGAQSYLFRTVDLDARTPRQKYYQSFHDLLINNPRLAVHVRHFRLADDSEDDYGSESSPWITSSRTLAQTLGLLCRLESFSISFTSEFTDWNAIPAPTRGAISRLFSLSSLEAVSLDFIASFPPQLLVSLTRLRHVSLSNVDVDDSSPFSCGGPDLPSSANSGIQSLRLRGTSPRTIQILTHSLQASPPTLRRLSISPTFEVGFCDALNELLKSSAGALISYLEWMPAPHLPSSVGSVDIASLLHLRSLKFLTSFRDFRQGPFCQAISFLDQLTSRPSQLERITFDCHFLQLPCRFTPGGVLREPSSKAASSFDVEAWHHLEKVLLHPAFKDVKQVVFELAPSSCVDLDQYRAEMAFRELDLFSGLRNRGVVVSVRLEPGRDDGDLWDGWRF